MFPEPQGRFHVLDENNEKNIAMNVNDTAASLFNDYLKIASKSPRVISASRPSSPVIDNLTKEEKVKSNEPNIFEINSKLISMTGGYHFVTI